LGHSLSSKSHRSISWDIFSICLQLQISTEHFVGHIFNMSSTSNLNGAFLGTFFQLKISSEHSLGHYVRCLQLKNSSGHFLGHSSNVFNLKSHRSISWDILSTQNLVGALLGTFFQLKISSEHFLGLSLTSLQLKISMEHFLGHSFNSKSHGIIFWDIM
jgi:hypothetical protein